VNEDPTLNQSPQAHQDRPNPARLELLELRARLEWLERNLWENKVRRADLTARLKDRDRWIKGVRDSRAWKMIKPFWKLQQHFSRARHRRPEGKRHGELVFALDCPEPAFIPGELLQISGWCFAHGGPEIVGVRAKVGSKSYLARYGLERHNRLTPAADYPAALHSGFSVSVPILPGASSFRLEAIAQGGLWECFFEKSLNQPIDYKTSGNTKPAAALDQKSLTLFPDITAQQVVSVIRDIACRSDTQVRIANPRCSIITLFSNLSPRCIAEAAAGLLKQSCSEWEWCLVLEANPNAEMRQLLEQIAAEDSRFHFLTTEASNVCEALNFAIEAAHSEVLSFVEPQGILERNAVEQMIEKVSQGFDVVYPDEDKFDERSGNVVEPFFKPEWSPEYFRGAMYVGNFFAVRRELATRLRFDPAFEGIHESEFMLRASEAGARFGHVAKVLYHSRKAPACMVNRGGTERVGLLQQRAVNEHLRRLKLRARAELAATAHRLKIVPESRTSYRKISILIPTKDSPGLLSRCLGSLHENTSYPAFETILIDNNTTNSEALALMHQYPVTRLHLPDPFNFCRANNFAARHATGEFLLFLNNDTEIVTPRWLDHLLYYAEQEDVGAVGALLLHDNGTVQHAGVVLGIGGTGNHAMRGFSAMSDGYMGSLSCAREVSAVTAACMMMRKSLFDELGGFNENFVTMYQDLDLCLRLRKRSLRIILTPQALLVHHESVSRQKYYDKGDRHLLLDLWQDAISQGDPYYNPNLSLERGDYSRK
jgi:O-antigen biosynthesis protein